jgi:hypothetical protein
MNLLEISARSIHLSRSLDCDPVHRPSKNHATACPDTAGAQQSDDAYSRHLAANGARSLPRPRGALCVYGCLFEPAWFARESAAFWLTGLDVDRPFHAAEPARFPPIPSVPGLGARERLSSRSFISDVGVGANELGERLRRRRDSVAEQLFATIV